MDGVCKWIETLIMISLIVKMAGTNQLWFIIHTKYNKNMIENIQSLNWEAILIWIQITWRTETQSLKARMNYRKTS